MTRTFHDDLLVIDGHGGCGFTASYAPALRKGGIDAYCCAIGWMKSARNTLDDIAALYASLEQAADAAALVTSVAELQATVAAGKVGVIMEFENTLPLDGDLHMVDIFYRLGLRVMQLTYNERNLVADGCTERTDAGLSDFGLQVIERMNRLGILVSLSHTGKHSCMEALEASSAPCVYSHSNPLAFCNHPRNIDDEQIRAVARKGGLVGICAIGMFLRLNSTAANPSTVEDYLDCVDHVARLAGVEHVGLGLDLIDNEEEFSRQGVMSWRNFPPERSNRIFKPQFIPPADVWHTARGLEKISDMPNVTAGLLRRGYSKSDIALIMGGNWLRVFKQAWGK